MMSAGGAGVHQLLQLFNMEPGACLEYTCCRDIGHPSWCLGWSAARVCTAPRVSAAPLVYNQLTVPCLPRSVLALPLVIRSCRRTPLLLALHS